MNPNETQHIGVFISVRPKVVLFPHTQTCYSGKGSALEVAFLISDSQFLILYSLFFIRQQRFINSSSSSLECESKIVTTSKARVLLHRMLDFTALLFTHILLK